MEKIIESLILEGTVFAVGCDGITRILWYQENGEMAPVNWYHVFKGEFLASDINGRYVVSISYKNPEDKF